jgi:hypothetical protein
VLQSAKGKNIQSEDHLTLAEGAGESGLASPYHFDNISSCLLPPPASEFRSRFFNGHAHFQSKPPTALDPAMVLGEHRVALIVRACGDGAMNEQHDRNR